MFYIHCKYFIYYYCYYVLFLHFHVVVVVVVIVIIIIHFYLNVFNIFFETLNICIIIQINK